MNNGKHGQGTCAWTKMGADKPAEENTPYAPKLICPNCLPKPKSLGFQWKKVWLGVRSPCLQLANPERTKLFSSLWLTLFYSAERIQRILHPYSKLHTNWKLAREMETNYIWTKYPWSFWAYWVRRYGFRRYNKNIWLNLWGLFSM